MHCIGRQAAQLTHTLPPSTQVDPNALFTELNLALQSEDYAKAARIRDALRRSQDGEAPALLDWHGYGIPEWLCERAEQLGWRYPTGVLLKGVNGASSQYLVYTSGLSHSQNATVSISGNINAHVHVLLA